MNKFWTKEWFNLVIIIIIILIIIYIFILLNRNSNKILINTNDIQVVANKLNNKLPTLHTKKNMKPINKNWFLN